MIVKGMVSWFGGPEDMGVAPDEGLAFIDSVNDAPQLFLSYQPVGTTGLARRLNPESRYVATRWDYNQYPKPVLLEWTALIRNVLTDQAIEAYPADWGPHVDTGRVADVSPGVMEVLGLETDDEVEVTFPHRYIGEPKVPYQNIVISSGHGLYVRGASGVLDEVDEARRVTDEVAAELRERGVNVVTFHDDTSHNQNTNLQTIVNFHNRQERQLDISVHFNAFEQTDKPRGTEVWYVTQSALAGQISAAIAKCGFINRGAKEDVNGLYFLRNTTMPAVLLEVCFVDSSADAEVYNETFNEICDAIATVLGGPGDSVEPLPPDELPPPAVQDPARVDITVSGNAIVTVNGVVVG